MATKAQITAATKALQKAVAEEEEKRDEKSRDALDKAQAKLRALYMEDED